MKTKPKLGKNMDTVPENGTLVRIKKEAGGPSENRGRLVEVLEKEPDNCCRIKAASGAPLAPASDYDPDNQSSVYHINYLEDA